MLLMILVLWFLCKIKQNSFLDIFFLLITFLLKRYRKEKFIFGHSWEQKYWLVDCLTKYHWTTKGRKDEWLDWLVECLTDWLRLSKWLTEKSTDCPVLLTDWLTSCLSDQSTNRPSCLTDWLSKWLTLTDWATQYWLNYWWTDWPTCALIDWQSDLSTDWHSFVLTDWVTDR